MSFFETFGIRKRVPAQKPDAAVAAGACVVKQQINLSSGHRIEVVLGDLTSEKVDAIVNAANGHLSHGGGLARAIVKKGGPVIVAESRKIMAKAGVKRLPDGTVEMTSAGHLPCRYVLHAVGPVYKDGQQGEDEALILTMRNVLTLADKHRLATVSCPGISSGIFLFPKARCAELLMRTALEYFAAHPTSAVRVLRFVNFDSETTQHFDRAAQAVLQRMQAAEPQGRSVAAVAAAAAAVAPAAAGLTESIRTPEAAAIPAAATAEAGNSGAAAAAVATALTALRLDDQPRPHEQDAPQSL